MLCVVRNEKDNNVIQYKVIINFCNIYMYMYSKIFIMSLIGISTTFNTGKDTGTSYMYTPYKNNLLKSR